MNAAMVFLSDFSVSRGYSNAGRRLLLIHALTHEERAYKAVNFFLYAWLVGCPEQAYT